MHSVKTMELHLANIVVQLPAHTLA